MYRKKSGRASDYSVDKAAEEFFINGYFVRDLKRNDSLLKLLELVKEIDTEPKDGFKWDKKYERSEDLYPNAYDYDDIFLNFLTAQNIPQLLRNITGYDLMLGDVALRRHHPGRSYMSWHRDTYFYKGQTSVGRMPPIYKIIIYFALGEEPTPQLLAIPGSHHRVSRNRYLDYALARVSPKDTIHSSDTSFFFFNSMLYHSVPNNEAAKPSLRLFYNFCQDSQLKHFPGRESLHTRYKSALNQTPLSPASHLARQDRAPAAQQVPSQSP